MAQPVIMFRVDIGFDLDRGYAAIVADVHDRKMKGIKGNSIRQLMRRVSEVICEEEQKKRRFPLESEKKLIITPDNGE